MIKKIVGLNIFGLIFLSLSNNIKPFSAYLLHANYFLYLASDVMMESLQNWYEDDKQES